MAPHFRQNQLVCRVMQLKAVVHTRTRLGLSRWPFGQCLGTRMIQVPLVHGKGSRPWPRAEGR